MDSKFKKLITEFERSFRIFDFKRIFERLFRIFGIKRILCRLFIFTFFRNLCRFYRLSDKSVFMPNIRPIILFFIFILFTIYTIVLHLIQLHLIFSTDIVIKDPGGKLGSGARREPQASQASDTNFFGLEGAVRGVGL